MLVDVVYIVDVNKLGAVGIWMLVDAVYIADVDRLQTVHG